MSDSGRQAFDRRYEYWLCLDCKTEWQGMTGVPETCPECKSRNTFCDYTPPVPVATNGITRGEPMNEVPRRNDMQRWSEAERAIYDAMQAVEAAGADLRLTDAVTLLGAARDSVADFIDQTEPLTRRLWYPKEEVTERSNG